MEYVSRHIETTDWITILIVLTVVLYAVSKFLYPKRFQEFMLLPITNKYFLVQGRDNEIQHPFNILLFVPQVISVSLLIYLVFKTEYPQIVADNSWLYVHICTAYSSFVLIKYYIEKIVGNVFGIEKLVNQYLYQKLTYRNLLAIVVFIVNLILFFVFEPTIMLLVLFFGILALINAVTLFYSYKTNGKLILRNFFYFILYLCALEISPYLILYKVFVNQGDF